MALVALLFAHHGAGHDGEPPAALSIAGLTVIERQVATVRSQGATRVLVVVERMPPGLAAALDRADVEIVRVATGLRIAPEDRVLVLGDSLLIDTRIVAAVLTGGVPTLAVWRGRAAHGGAERLDPTTHWAGVALYSGEMLAATVAGLGEWDLQATLLRAAYTDGRPSRIDLSTITAGEAPLLWAPIRTSQEAADAARAELQAGQDACCDWPTRLVFAPVEDAVMPRLLARRVTPRSILAVAPVPAALAVVAFAAGYLWAGLILTMLSGPTLSVASRVAYIRRDESRAAKAIEPIALVVVAGCYGALAFWFSQAHEWVAPWAVGALAVTSAGGTAASRALYRRQTTRSLDESGAFERRLRLLGGQPNALIWSLPPFAALDLWWTGYLVLATYALCTFLLTGWRLFVRLPGNTPASTASERPSPIVSVAPRPSRMFEDDSPRGKVGGK